MTVEYNDLEKNKHRTIENVYSILDDKDDDFVTVCYDNELTGREEYKDVKKNWITRIGLF